jgi:hypothetical protein
VLDKANNKLSPSIGINRCKADSSDGKSGFWCIDG